MMKQSTMDVAEIIIMHVTRFSHMHSITIMRDNFFAVAIQIRDHCTSVPGNYFGYGYSISSSRKMHGKELQP